MTEINLNTIISNIDNSRDSAPNLQGLGYGIVEPVKGSSKPSLFVLALGTPDDKRRYCELIEQYEEELLDLAQTIQELGQLQNCRVRPLGDGQYALTFGARRSLAILYLHCKTGIPATVMATVSKADEKAAVLESAAENIHLPPSFMDQARLFKRLQDQGMTVKDIAKVYPMGKATEQNIRHRLRLLQLPLKVQLKVHHGKLSQDSALKLLKNEETNSGAEPKPTPRQGKVKTGVVGKLMAKKPDDKQEHSQVVEGDILQAILEDFVTRLTDLDLENYQPTDPDGLLRLTERARSLLTIVEKAAS
jgi:ParB/RepB/Spo0J family partition protein